MIKNITFFLLFACCCLQGLAQERIVDLNTNAIIIQQNQDLNLGEHPTAAINFGFIPQLLHCLFKMILAELKTRIIIATIIH